MLLSLSYVQNMGKGAHKFSLQKLFLLPNIKFDKQTLYLTFSITSRLSFLSSDSRASMTTYSILVILSKNNIKAKNNITFRYNIIKVRVNAESQITR